MRGGNKKKAMEIAMVHKIPIDDFPSSSNDNEDPEVLQTSV
jgi:intraflagellar transport protein 140